MQPLATYALIAAAIVFTPRSALAQVTALPFNGVNAVGLRMGYGDRVAGAVSGGYAYGGSGTYTPNVLASIGGFENGVYVTAFPWGVGYNDLVNVIYVGVSGIAGIGGEIQVTLAADPGFVVALEAFDLGNFGAAVTLPYVRVRDESAATLFEDLNVSLFAGTSPLERNYVLSPAVEARILTLHIGLAGLAGNADNIGVDNVRFSQRAAATFDLGVRYCAPGQTNGSGGPGVLRAFGQPAVAANDVTLFATGLPSSAFGYFLTSRTPGLVVGPGGSAGVLCLGGAIGRYVGPGQVLNTHALGHFALAIDLASMPTPTGFVAAQVGETWHFQAWHRDAIGGGAPTSNFTDALALTFS